MSAGLPISNPRSRRPAVILLRLAVFLGVCGVVAAGEAALFLYAKFAADLPVIPPFEAIRFGTVSTVRAAHGQVLAEVFEERRYLLPRDRIPDRLVQAFVASEDARFFEHSGLDLLGIARAVVANVRAGRVREGASTLTQQLARSLLLGHERTLARKVREAILARRIEDLYTKDQILLLYLNLIYLGEGTYGVQAAARGYFGKDVSELTLSEAAVLAGLPQAPSRRNPVADPEGTRARRDRVLRRMVEAGFITAAQEAEARAEPIRTVAQRDNLGDRAPVPTVEVVEALRPVLDAEANPLRSGGGLVAETTLDLGLQRLAHKAVFAAAESLARRQGYRGPVARLAPERHDEFLARNRQWLAARGWWPDLPRGPLVLALVREVSREGALVDVGPGVGGGLPLERMKWAAPYTEFPVANPGTGERREVARVSLDGRVKDATSVLAPGDVILVRRAETGPAARGRGAGPSDAPEGLVFDLAQFPGPQAALVAVEPRSGALVAVAGTTDFDVSQVDRTRSMRQTGSAIKPLYYSKAYDLAIPPSTVVSGAPFREGTWTPTGEKGAPDMTLFEALTRSENTVSLRVFRMVLDRVGADGLNEWARSFGLGGRFQGFPAEALGVDATPREMAGLMATLAAGGVRPEMVLVKAVRDGEGRLLVDRRSSRDPTTPVLDALAREVAAGPDAARRVLSREVAFVTASNLRRVAEVGTASRARRLGRPVCGKTGTLPFDVWFVGWTHEVAAVMWVGQDQRERFLGRSREAGKVYGADTALPAWLEFVRAATAGRPVVDDLAQVPEGIVVVPVDPATGLLARDGGIPMPHLAGTEPTELAPLPDEGPVDDRLTEF